MRYLNMILVFLALSISGSSQSGGNSKLSGVVYDAYGAVVSRAKVTAVSAKGEKFETITDDNGSFVLNLPFSKYDNKSGVNFKEAKYDIIVYSPGFARSITKGFVFVPSYKGTMYFDIGLEIGACGDCEWIVGDPVKEIKKPT